MNEPRFYEKQDDGSLKPIAAPNWVVETAIAFNELERLVGSAESAEFLWSRPLGVVLGGER